MMCSECSGSDTFGTDICTCRPYLVYALLGAVQCAQRGGVGIIIYFRKEGRSLGGCTKCRVRAQTLYMRVALLFLTCLVSCCLFRFTMRSSVSPVVIPLR